jgi:glycosyltransferase involved in cell wall biosynthesis
MPPRISVVVPTHDRRDSLLRLLAALAAGTYPHADVEVVVVADGCTDGTTAAVRHATFPFPVHVVEQSRGRGAGAARNLGAAHATGALLVFLDDDIEPLPTLLAAHAQAHAAADGTEPTVVVGPALPVRPTRCGFHALSVWAWWEEQFQRMAAPGHRFSYADVLSGNCSIAAATFAAVGGFDDTLPESCRDDFELGLRLIAADARIVHVPAAGGRHHDATDRPRLMRRKRAEGRADVILARRHPGLATALPLAAVVERPASRLALLRRLAFAGPLGAVPVALWTWQLDLLERLGLRGRWRWLQQDIQAYWYWRGVADAAGDRAAVADLLAHAAADVEERAASAFEIDLHEGLAAAERRLDEARPDAVRIRHGAYEVGTVAPRPGTERLRGAHLRPLLADSLAGPLLGAILLGAAGTATDLDDALRPLGA